MSLPDGSGLRIPAGGVPVNAAVVGRRGLVGTAYLIPAAGSDPAELRVTLLSDGGSIAVRVTGVRAAHLAIAYGQGSGVVSVTSRAPVVPLRAGERIVTGNLSPRTSPPDGVPVGTVISAGRGPDGTATATILPRRDPPRPLGPASVG